MPDPRVLATQNPVYISKAHRTLALNVACSPRQGWQVIDPAGIEWALFALWLLRLVGFGAYAKEL